MNYFSLGSLTSRSLYKIHVVVKWEFAFKLLVKVFIIACFYFMYLMAHMLYFSIHFQISSCATE